MDDDIYIYDEKRLDCTRLWVDAYQGRILQPCLGVGDMIRPHAANVNAPLAHDDQLAVARKVRRQQAARMPMDYRPLAIEARQCVETLVGPTPPAPPLLNSYGHFPRLIHPDPATFRPHNPYT